jgi:signal transduction histidine kinase
MPVEEASGERQLRAMVALVEAQAEQLVSLRAAVDDLQGRLAMRCELDVIVANQLSSPVEEIGGSLAQLRQLPSDDVVRDELIDHASYQASVLGDVVNDLLVPQGIGDTMVGRAHMHRIDLSSVLDRALALMSDRFERDRVVVEVAEQVSVVSSAPRLVAMVVNLLDHGLSRTDEGIVEVRACLHPSGVARIEVADRGPIIGPHEVEALFRPFQDTDLATGNVGLYLVRMLARSLGGDALVTARPGGGIVVSVELPQRRDTDLI